MTRHIDADERERLWFLIRGGILAMSLPMNERRRLLELVDSVTEPCPKCNGIMVPEAMKCRECGPTP